MKKFIAILILVFLCPDFSKSQTLVMNEVSNGPSGNKEYVEFIVVDTNVVYNCVGITNPPCIDIRGWVFDDNDGYHGASGIAAGCIRFSNNSVWSCIPVGTMLLLYNDQDVDLGSMPAIDTSMIDGNCRLVVPVNKPNWFDHNNTTPGNLACSYPGAGWAPCAAGTWSNVFLANIGDCARLVNLAGCEVFSVCWGSDNLNNLIYMAGSAAQRVYFFDNSISNNPSNNANWTNGCASVGTCGSNLQTPGAPNNVANAAWIHSMNNNCTPIPPLVVTSNTTNGSCPCTSSASVSPSGSIPPYSYTWSPTPGSGQGTGNAGGLCTGTYSCLVKSNITGCTKTVTISITNGSVSTNASNTGSYCAGTTIQLNASPANSYTWSGPGGFTAGIQNPTLPSSTPSMSGTYSLVVTIGTCTAAATTSVTVNPLPTPSANNNGPLCIGNTLNLSGGGGGTYQWIGPNSFTSAIQNPSIASTSTLNNGIYSCTVTLGGCTATAATNAVINTATASASNTGSYCAATTIQLNASPANSYTWSGPGGYTASSQNPTLPSSTTTMSGTYSLIVTIGSCTAAATTSVTVNPLPVTSINNNGPLCVGNPLNLSGGGGGTYQWIGPNSFTSAVQNPSIASTSTLNSGVYSCTVTLGGCTATASTNVIVTTGTASASNTGSYCAGSTIQLNGSIGTGYSWTGPGGYTSNTQNPIISSSNPSMSGVYNLTVTIGTCTASATTSVLVNALPSLTISNNVPVCAGQAISLNGAGGGTYSWMGPLGFTSTIQNPTINTSSPPNSGTYTLVVTAPNTCTNTITTNVVVNPLPVAVVNGSNTCVGGILNLTATGGSNYLWSGPGGFTSSNQNPIINIASVSNSGVYSVTVTDANNCSKGSTVSIVINALPVTIANGSDVCQGNSINLNSNGGGNYTWIGPNSFSSSVQNPVINNSSLSNSGIYLVTVTNSNSCVNTASVNVTVNPLPNVTLTANDFTFCKDSTCRFFAASDGNSFSWSGPAGFTSSLQNPSISNLSPSNNGVYSLTVTSTKSCFATGNISILVDACLPEVFIPEGFSPNGDNAHDLFVISGIEGKKTGIDIYNRWGNLIYQNEDYRNNWEGKTNSGLKVLGDDLPAGTYYYIVKIVNETKARTGYVTLWR